MAVTTRFDELCEAFQLRPIKNDAGHRKAIDVIRPLMNSRDADVLDYVKSLAALISAYEDEANHRLDTSGASASDIVRSALTDRGMSVTALASAIKVSQGTLNDAMTGKRGWSKALIIKVADYLNLSAETLLRRAMD